MVLFVCSIVLSAYLCIKFNCSDIAIILLNPAFWAIIPFVIYPIYSKVVKIFIYWTSDPDWSYGENEKRKQRICRSLWVDPNDFYYY